MGLRTNIYKLRLSSSAICKVLTFIRLLGVIYHQQPGLPTLCLKKVWKLSEELNVRVAVGLPRHRM